MALSRPLAIAALAGVLLVLVVGADATMDRSLHVERREDDGAWRALASEGEVPLEERALAFGPGVVRVEDRNATLDLRVRVANGYPWGFDEEYVARVNGAEVARGRVEAPPRSTGTSEFTVPVQRILGQSGGEFPRDVASPSGHETHYGGMDVTVGRTRMFVSLNVEVPAR